jgi:hypothetical protein
MTEQPQPKPPATARRAPSLYRTVLSLAVAAIVAATLPFSALYLTALQRQPATVTTISAPHTPGVTRVITTASGAARTVPAGTPANASLPTPTPVTTQAS